MNYQNQKSLADAQSYLKQLNRKNKERCAKILEENKREVTRLENYITTKKQVNEIEFCETKSDVQKRMRVLKNIKAENLKKNKEDLRKISQLNIQIDKLQENIKKQEEKIRKNEEILEKFQRPPRSFLIEFEAGIKKVEEEVKIAEAKLYLLTTCERLAEDPERYDEFLRTLSQVVEPKDVEVKKSSLWDDSGIGKVLQKNYREIKDLEEQIGKAEEIISGFPESDEKLMKILSEKMRKEEEACLSKYQRKLDKKVKDFEFVREKELDMLRAKLEDLQEKVLISEIKRK